MLLCRRAVVLGLLSVAALTLTFTPLAGCRATGGHVAQPESRRTPPKPLPTPVRGVWVARFHYRYPDDIRTIMANCAAVGCNTVFWQVRGEGTVAYPSAIEPWSREYEFRDPGFDPLAIAVEEAHRHGLRLEAWINTMPGWKGPQEPPMRNQLYNAHPDWFLYDQAGRRQPLTIKEAGSNRTTGTYVILNPCRPEVRAYLARVVEEIVKYYDVDGIHLDYIRYAWDGLPGARENYPRDPRTLSLYRHETGKSPEDDPAAWHHWRANQLTRLVVALRQTVNARRPGATLTAATWGDAVDGYDAYLQNGAAWLRAGIIDAAMPMAYRESTPDLVHDIAVYRDNARGRRVVPGLGLYKLASSEAVAAQLACCAGWGGDAALFSYESLFATAGDRGRDRRALAADQRQRQVRRTAVERAFGR